MTTCSLPDCTRPLKARGWCNRHYLRWWTHGDPLVDEADLGDSA